MFVQYSDAFLHYIAFSTYRLEVHTTYNYRPCGEDFYSEFEGMEAAGTYRALHFVVVF